VIVVTDTVAAARERRDARLAAKDKPRTKMRLRRRMSARRRERSDPAYLRAIHGLPCLVCGKPGEAHHEPPKGMGGGGDWHDRKTVPLCDEHHKAGRDSRHRLGLAAFEAAHGLNLEDEIARLQEAHG